MKYALLIYNETTTGPDPRPPEVQERVLETVREVIVDPATDASIRLRDPDTATTVRFDRGERLLTDGPFVDSKEFLAGVIVVEAPNLDAALDVAARLQEDRVAGGIEVRPLRAEQMP